MVGKEVSEEFVGLWGHICASPTSMKPFSITLNELRVPALQCGAAGLGFLQLKHPNWRRARAANSTFCRRPLALEPVSSPISVKQPKYY